MQKSLVMVPCPICGERKNFHRLKITDRDAHIRNYGYLYHGHSKSSWKSCDQCGFVHQNPRPSTTDLNDYYKSSSYHAYNPIDENSVLRGFYENYRISYKDDIDFLLKNISIKKGKIFDIGHGYGFALKKYELLGWDCYGVEPDKKRFNFALNKLQLKNVKNKILTKNFQCNKKFDVIISHHTMEHIADLEDLMNGVSKLLKNGGYFFASIPTYYQNRSKMSLYYMNSSHYSIFTHKSMSALLAKYGIKYINHKYYHKYGVGVTDDLYYVGQKTEKSIAPQQYFEGGSKVSTYVNYINPLRSTIYGALYSTKYRDFMTTLWPKAKDAYFFLLNDRKTFWKKVQKRIGINAT